jgi:hypothetical protein
VGDDGEHLKVIVDLGRDTGSSEMGMFALVRIADRFGG